MRFAARLKRRVSVAPIDRSTRPVTYGEPIHLWVNILSTSSDAVVDNYGIRYSEVLQITCDKKYAERIHEMDLVYVFTEPPTFYNGSVSTFAEGADYVVDSKLESLTSTVIILSRRTNIGDR